MADTNDYLDALNSYQDQISSFKAKVDQVRNFDKQESKFGDAFSFVADPLGAHLLATYGGDAIGNLRNSLSEVTQGIRQTTGLGEGFGLPSGSGLGESLGLPSGSGLTSGLTDSFSKFMNQFAGPDKSLGDVELTDFVSGDAAPVAESIGSSLASRLSGIASLVTRGPGLSLGEEGLTSGLGLGLGEGLMSGIRSGLGESLGRGLGLPSGLPDISELMNLTGAESRVLDVGALAKSYVDPMLEGVKQSFMDIPEINLTGLGEGSGLASGGTAITDLTAGGEQALSKTVGLAEEGLTPLISGVGEGLEAAGEAVAAAGSEAVIPALVGGLVTAAGLIVSELDKNKERLPTLPNVAAPQFIPGLG